MALPFKDTPEEAAFHLVPRFLGGGVLAEPHDHSGRQGAVDFLLRYPDGRVAAMEVTSSAGSGLRQLYALLAKYETLPNPGAWTWSATIGHPRDLPELLQRYRGIILYCEAKGIASPQQAYDHRGNPDIAWVFTSTVEFWGAPSLPKWDVEKQRERPLFLTPAGREAGSTNLSEASRTRLMLWSPRLMCRSGSGSSSVLVTTSSTCSWWPTTPPCRSTSSTGSPVATSRRPAHPVFPVLSPTCGCS